MIGSFNDYEIQVVLFIVSSSETSCIVYQKIFAVWCDNQNDSTDSPNLHYHH